MPCTQTYIATVVYTYMIVQGHAVSAIGVPHPPVPRPAEPHTGAVSARQWLEVLPIWHLHVSPVPQ